MTTRASPLLRGTVLLFLLGLLTVMLVVAFAFLRSMQMSRGTSQVQRRDDLARLAAEMGMQHAIAVCIHEYAMPSERVDGVTVAARSNPDSPAKNVFNLLSPRENTTAAMQPPRPWDLAPDVPFQDLFSYFTGTYHAWSSKVAGFATGWSLQRGYGRFFEPNRFSIDTGAVYDAASYDQYDPASPVPGAVQTPFPPVDPWTGGTAFTRRHALDNPLWLDADYRPVADLGLARYRLRYAVSATDMSGALWMNTDMPWLSGARKDEVRRAYKDAIDAVGTQLVTIRLGANNSASIASQYPFTLESVFLGQGPMNNSQFPGRDGVPCDWPTRNHDGFAAPGAPQPMAYRSDYLYYGADNRAFHCILGSPAMNWFDPPGRWLGSAIPAWTDLAFAVLEKRLDWVHSGETFNTSAGQEVAARGDSFAHRAATPFGHPEGSTDHPWAVNVLAVPARVLQAMVAAYVPPAVRRVVVTKESHVPYYQYVDGSGNTNTGCGAITYGSQSWSARPLPASGTDVWTTWDIPAGAATAANLTIPGLGHDLFTDAYRPRGTTPFAYPTPAYRDYWGSSPGERPDFTPVLDARANAERYPGELFFGQTEEFRNVAPVDANPNRMTRWASVASDPRQVEDDGTDRSLLPPIAAGVDHLARHIVFYRPDGGTKTAAVGGCANYITAYQALSSNWDPDFTPATPFGLKNGPPGSCAGMSIYLPSSESISPAAPAAAGAGNPAGNETYAAFPTTTAAQVAILTAPLAARGVNADHWRVVRSAGTASTDPATTARNSYWQRLSLAFLQAVAVAQAANLAWADPQDNRSQKIWQPIASGFTGGPTYSVNPNDNATIVRKGPGHWDPKAADFATLEQLDRQFLANLGESFDHPGTRTTTEALSERPPRYLRYQSLSYSYPGPATFDFGTFLNVAEYRVSNNIRTLLTPIDASGGATLTARSTDPQSGVHAPPRNLWLLDEWNAEGDAGYSPPTPAVAGPPVIAATAGSVGAQPTHLARARAKLMERVLNDWRMSFLGASAAYAPSFRPKDFDGDGRVFCSGYGGSGADGDTGLTCWKPADPASGDGPGTGAGLDVVSVTGSLVFTRSHQYKIHVRGELVDTLVDKAVCEHYLEAGILVDPDGNVSRGTLPTGLTDSTVMLLRPLHNYYRGYLSRGYP